MKRTAILRKPDGNARASVPVRRKCRVCKEPFLRSMSTQVVCGHACASTWAKDKREKLERADIRAKREAIKPRSQWLKEAQTAFNAYIRARDHGKACISCIRNHTGQWHAGHFMSIGAKPELRFCEWNVHKQCQPCNTHLHGNLVLYRLALVERYGAHLVTWLEGPHEPKKYTIEQLREIRDTYRAKTRELTKAEK